MNIGKIIKSAGFCSALLCSTFLANLANAQDISDEHLKASRNAVAALEVTSGFDNILPNLAAQIKAALIQANPNFADEISLAVDDEAIKLASRRADLENCLLYTSPSPRDA